MGGQNSKDNIIVEQSPSIATAASVTAGTAGLELAEILLVVLVIVVSVVIMHKIWKKVQKYFINAVEKRINARSIQGAASGV